MSFGGMVEVGDMFRIGNDCNSLSPGWYILKEITGSGDIVIDFFDGRTQSIRWTSISEHIREGYSIGGLEIYAPCLIRRYLELMGITEPIDWIAEGF